MPNLCIIERAGDGAKADAALLGFLLKAFRAPGAMNFYKFSGFCMVFPLVRGELFCPDCYRVWLDAAGAAAGGLYTLIRDLGSRHAVLEGWSGGSAAHLTWTGPGPFLIVELDVFVRPSV